ncbi:CRE_HP_G0020980.mRNA.1.CDS.1 [Saccharomyces cerevisiae]|nr:CRE_HP_G0020980.mRNA.1.CDS.1 [Saccharomyces cerevisiae]CAI6460503.1 CRE_HP_G0020980.mRNA.1.CDS.1 [Saccharomyces cerevisiae]
MKLSSTFGQKIIDIEMHAHNKRSATIEKDSKGTKPIVIWEPFPDLCDFDHQNDIKSYDPIAKTWNGITFLDRLKFYLSQSSLQYETSDLYESLTR